MPQFGRQMLRHWALDPAVTYLNHGTVGVTPTRVLAAQRTLSDQIERQPSRFLLRELMHNKALVSPGAGPCHLRTAAQAVARQLGARGEDLVFVDNATSGCAAVLNSLSFQAGDEILLLDHGYGALTRTAGHVAQRFGARITTARLPFPHPTAVGCVQAIQQALTPRTKLALLDHIASETALLLPLRDMAAACHAAGVPVLADGAHAPGAIALDIPALGVDWYAANLHKWAFAPRGSGILWAAPERQAGLHPPVISWGYGLQWHQEFDWTGTRDPSGWLSCPAGWLFMDEVLGGVDAMRAYNHALAWHAATALPARWGLAPVVSQDFVGCMAVLPLPPALGGDAAAAQRLKDWLLFEQHIEAPVSARAGRLWLRVSAQVYNDVADLDLLGAAIERAPGSM